MNAHSIIGNFGGKAGVSDAVAMLYERLLDDAEVAPYFDDVDLPALRNHMVDFLVAALSGSSAEYSGRPLDEAHRGLAVTDEAFDHVVGHLIAVLNQSGVDAGSVVTLIDRVAPLRSQVVL